MSRAVFAAAVSLLALSAIACQAQAASPADCTVAGLVQGGGMLDQENMKLNSSTLPVTNWVSGFGEVTANYGCASWWVQADGAYYGFGATNSGLNFTESHFHGGGAAAWKIADMANIGLAASFIGQSSAATPIGYSQSGAIFRLGGFVQISPSDMFLVGFGAHHVGGTTPWLGDLTQNMAIDGWEGEAYIRFYPTENLALGLRGDLMHSTLSYAPSFFTADYGGHAFSAEAEYLVPDTGLSLFAGARFANRVVSFGSNTDVNDDTQEYIGFRFAFGPPANTTLRNRDFNGNYDNTSVFQEKLPDLGGTAPFT